MYTASRIRALSKLAEDLQPIHKQVHSLMLDFQARVADLEELKVGCSKQKALASDLHDLAAQIESLLFTLDVSII